MGSFSYLRAVAAVLFAAVCAYIGAKLYPALSPRPDISVPLSGRSIETVDLEGIALREEKPLYLPEGAELCAVPGQRLAAAQAVGVFADGSCVKSGRSAIFMSGCDGLEGLSPEDALPLSCEGVAALMDRPTSPAKSQGRLVFGFDWYYAALCRYAGELPKGEYELCFDGSGQKVRARLFDTAEGADGQRALLFRVQLGDTGLLSLRRCSARLILPQSRQA